MTIQPSVWSCNDGGTTDRGVVRQTGGVIPGASQTKGRLLVATPPLDDPNFDRTVVYVIEHHPDGALGVVINRPTGEPL
ncbi:MAG: YqgE/AlgH family protein, partial [Acidimicrobiia bacterium]